MSGGRRVALALGSGGARGFAHVGVVQVLEERGFEVCSVAGSSMGALVGGVMATGRLKEFTDWAVALKQRDILRLIDPKWALPGAMAADRLINHLNDFLGDAEIEHLPIPYTAVATDINARREVWFQRGLLRSAIRASIAIPGLITPVVINGRLLADGGLLNPVPIEPTAASGADLTVAVSLQAPRPQGEPASPVRAAAAPHWYEDWRDRLRHVFQTRNGSAAPLETPDLTEISAAADPLPGNLRIADVLASSLDAMQDMIARYRMAGLPPDVHIAVPVNACRVMDFHRAGDMVTLGRQLATKALDDAGF
ncbi:patatin-like phospholipase family protein [Paractinoplanes atraurantiacus]|uniref:NTE family protein n=1 Tax=Paractinoplanes atraurantiacus TaxID=1036182 RepID=A0A285K8F7_9ACTN|nr:patatin-like phospholipase family protein [Actinoplanes atraurantiacus]SNY68855.1 NTE family protein [Actinoplanes atraurantiacus]